MHNQNHIIRLLLLVCLLVATTSSAQKQADSLALQLIEQGEWFKLHRLETKQRRNMSRSVRRNVRKQLDIAFQRRRRWHKQRHDIAIPFRLDSIGQPDNRQTAIIIPAQVNGTNVDFLFDTGASVNVVSRDIARRLQLTMTHDMRETQGNSTFLAERAVAKQLTIGNLLLTDVPFIVTENITGVDSIDALLQHTKAIIGLPLVQEMQVCELDFRQKVMRSAESLTSYEPNICYSSSSPLLTLEAWHTGDDIKILPDTGAGTTTLDNRWLTNHAATMVTDGDADSVIYAGYGAIVAGKEYRLPDFQITIGTTHVTLPYVTAFIGNYDQRLGMDFFSRIERMTIDLRRMVLRVLK